MAYKFSKKSDKPTKDLRLSIPGEHWEALESIAKSEGVEALEVIRDMIAYCLKSTRRGVTKNSAKIAEK